MTEITSESMSTEFPDGGRFVSAAEAEQIIKKRISAKGARRELYEVTENYVKTIPLIKDYAGLRKKLEKFSLTEQALVQLINLAPVTKQEISDYIPGGDKLNDVADDIIKIIKEELNSARHIDDDMMDVDSDINDEI